MLVQITLENASPRAVALRAVSALGEPFRASVEISSAEALSGETLVGTAARIEVVGDEGASAVYHGILVSVTSIATANADAQRRYELEVRSTIELLTLRKDARVFRKKTAVEIIKEVVLGVGVKGESFVSEVKEEPPAREYITQWNESDATFLRRICEEDGIFFRFDPKDGFDAFVIADSSADGPEVLSGPLRFVDGAGVRSSERVAFHATRTRKRKVGKVSLRDYDPAHPSLDLSASAEAGVDAEKATEVYQAPGRFHVEKDGKREATLRLEALRALADVLEFETTALSLRPGVVLEADCSATVFPVPEEKYFVVETSLAWRAGEEQGVMRVKAIPKSVPYRLARRTPRPRVPGILSATVTAASGEEIHTDAAGCVRLTFPWDRRGPTDENASLPVRVMQGNLPGSMLIPRAGWEVLVGFEDGDVDRPYVLGRSFHGRQLPPFSLPANKTISALGTVSSPGGAKPNRIHIDDAAGRQHMSFNAGFGKNTAVASNMQNQTVGVENIHVKGSQTWQVGGNQVVSVENAWSAGVGSQSASVGANQTITIKATGTTAVGSETVLIGGALIEVVGNPVAGLAEFGKAALLAGAGEIPVVGAALSKGYSWGNALYQGYKTGGFRGVAMAAGQTAAGEIAGNIPGGDAIVAAADGAGLTPWSEKAQQRAAEQAQGGGGAGPGAAGAGAAAAAPGHRKLVVDGAVTEVIGALHGIQTPGSLKWTTLGASTFAIGASHATSAVRISRLTMASSADTAAATSMQARASLGRNVKAAHNLQAGGAVRIKAGAEASAKASGALTIQVGGAASFEGSSVVFSVGSSSVSVHGGGVTLSSAQITINGENKHSGKESAG